MKVLKLTACVAALVFLTASASVAAQGEDADKGTAVKAGTLSCVGEGGWGYILGSQKTFRCAYTPFDQSPLGIYDATVTKFGLDLGVTGKTALQWVVFGPVSKVGGNYVGGSLAGNYAGVGAEANVGMGLGANALVGGGKNSFALQPISVQVSTGVSIAAGVQSLVLTYVGPAS